MSTVENAVLELTPAAMEPMKHRVCSCGCGRPLLNDDGTPTMSNKRFATKECLNRDKALRMAQQRLSRKHKARFLQLSAEEFVQVRDIEQAVRILQRRELLTIPVGVVRDRNDG